MAQRLRLYFGSGRSNTAPGILEGDSDEQREDGEVVTALRMHTPPLSQASRPPEESAAQHAPSTSFGLCSEPSLKRSSSMFIPQLAAYTEPRPTKSSSMHISLQRCNGSSSGDCGEHPDDVSPPSYTPPGPAPAYTEPRIQADFPQQPPPPYYCPGSLTAQSSLTEPNLPKRRVFSIGSSGLTTFARSQPGVSVGTICFQRNSPDGPDVQYFRILPYGGTGRSVRQQSPDQGCTGNGATQRLVFQLQRNRNQDQSQCQQQTAASQEECTDFGHCIPRGFRTIRYPKIRLQRSSPHQRVFLENKHPDSGAEFQTIKENQADVGAEAKNRSNGCTFQISGETPRRQPHFKIYFI